MVIIRRDRTLNEAEKLRNRMIETRVETKLGLTGEDQKVLNAIARIQFLIAGQFHELFKATSGSTENVRTINEKIKQVREKMKQLMQTSVNPKIAELEEKMKREIDQRISGIGTKEDLEMSRAEDDFEMVTVLRSYEAEGVAEAFDKSMERITKTLGEFSLEAKGDKKSIKWDQARLMIKIINKMSVEALGIVSQEYDPTNKIDLKKIAEDATRCPAMAYLEEETIERITRIVRILQSKEEIEVLGAIVDKADLFEIELDKLEKLAQSMREVEPDRRLVKKIADSIKMLKRPDQRRWLIDQITKRPDMLKYYKEEQVSDKVTEILFIAYLQFGQERINGLEVFQRIKELVAIEPEIKEEILLALPQLVHYEIFEEVELRIKRKDQTGRKALAKMNENKLDEMLEILYPKEKAQEIVEKGKQKSQTRREEAQRMQSAKIKLKHQRIILVSDGRYGREIGETLRAKIDGEVVLIDDDAPSIKYIKSIVREGDIVVIDASHIGHAKSGAAVVACRKNKVPYKIGKTTNAQRILDGIEMAA